MFTLFLYVIGSIFRAKLSSDTMGAIGILEILFVDWWLLPLLIVSIYGG